MRVFILPTGFAVQKRPNILKSACDFLTNKSKTASSSSRVLTRRINSPTVLRRPFQGQHFSHFVNSCYIRPPFNSLATIYLCRGRTYYFKFSITYQLLPSSILTLHTPYWRWVSLSVYQRFQTTPTNDSPHGIADPSKWQLLLTHSDVQTRASLTSTTSEFHPSCVSKFYIVTPQATHTTKLTFTYHHLSHSNIAIISPTMTGFTISLSALSDYSTCRTFMCGLADPSKWQLLLDLFRRDQRASLIQWFIDSVDSFVLAFRKHFLVSREYFFSLPRSSSSFTATPSCARRR